MPTAPREQIAGHLRASADALADAVLTRVQACAPGNASPDAATLRNLRLGARAAVDFFLARLAVDDEPDTALFVAHGRAQQAAGRSLPELLAFYRLGGMAMWEGAQALPISHELAPEAIFMLGAEALGTVDALSVAAVEGFTTQEAETLRRELARRERLASLLLSDRPSAPEQLLAAAEAAGWTLPPRVRVAVAALPIEPPPGSTRAGPARVLGATVDGGRRALVVAADDDAEAEPWLLRAARAQHLEPPLAIGPAVAPAHAARSLARAAALLDQAPALAAAPVPFPLLRCDDHEIDLLLGAAPELARAVVTRRLAAFDGLAATQRERLLETLAGWLAHPARPQAIADELGVHVQTVRYRLRQLRELLGTALDDPEARFELSVALRARQLTV
ncbi:CdaR family transcriptional regulator [Conexibacter sp. CPCC 206217]|uniref:PucR family transcriptional regulator n=1 Tax=Conexibacter sp. CPCC 206217 TaxID=3064574 RepID=UPI00271B4CE1|nr:helix-turn-helix domain-containing protein [Conexibacter sp. CPCC 206217]MDO8213662.1 helix-turn-helix domain-containing protein [Conexibacter sp. CPCC 206217]